MASALVRMVSTAMASLMSPTTASKTFLALSMQPVRCASKKAGGVVRNRVGRAKRKHYGIKVKDGTFVHKGDRLVKQFGLKYYPGENVIMDTDWSLRAALDGIVIMTTEELNPYPDSPLYAPVQNGSVINKHFFSVIPTPLHGKFKLVSET